MNPKHRLLPLLALALAGSTALAACGSDDTATNDDTTTNDAASEETATDQTATDDTADETATDETADDDTDGATTGDTGPGGGEGGTPPDGGGGGNPAGVDPASVTTEEALVEMIGGSTACGDGSLDLHRGHMPVESLLVEVLGISHDEMHVRMEQEGQNLAAVADDLGVGADTLEQELIDYLSPAIDNLLDAGTITGDQAAEYETQLEEAIDFRVNWDGEEAPPEFCTAAS